MERQELQTILRRISNELDSCIKFWIENSHDDEKGGFFNCLASDGTVYDTTKYCWLQGRQVWMYATLYKNVERFKVDKLYDSAVKGGEFLMKNVKNSMTGKCYFSVTRDGKPIKIQRTIYAEVFYVMAMCGLFMMTEKEVYRNEAIEMMEKILHWTGEGSSELGRPELSGAEPVSSLAVPMCVLSLVTMMKDLGWSRPRLEQECIKEILSHAVRGGDMVLETVSKEGGEEVDGVAGRMVNPGHVIECGWFLLDWAKRNDDNDLTQTAIETFIEKPLEFGWDKENMGIFYFLDADGHSPTTLEWDMKLWWVHLESMIATLMAYQHTNKENHLQSFQKIYNYSFSKFPLEGGEWAGYLDREGKVKMNFKGGPYKGCFHVPRALMICEKILKQLLEN